MKLERKMNLLAVGASIALMLAILSTTNRSSTLIFLAIYSPFLLAIFWLLSSAILENWMKYRHKKKRGEG
jgi:hypothetical protein